MSTIGWLSTHKWLSTDNGDQCFRCGIVLDYASPPDWPSTEAERERDERMAHDLVMSCTGPSTERAHHMVLEFDRLSCAYGDSVIEWDTSPEAFYKECVGA